jgi:uncharacterized protein YdiU (UPF0061 family)
MLVGFVHGVMNTDNMTISGETIDYGPCAFIDAFDPAAVFSSIDHAGRYAYGQQPQVAQWNLARFAEALLVLIDADVERAREAATGVLGTFPAHFEEHWSAGMAAKLGLPGRDRETVPLVNDLLALLHAQRVDHTSFFRALGRAAAGDDERARGLFAEPQPFDAWRARWEEALGEGRGGVAAAMDAVNPVYIPRNHRVDEALIAATQGDMAPFRALLEVLTRPFDERPELEDHAAPAPPAFAAGFRTFCGT